MAEVDVMLAQRGPKNDSDTNAQTARQPGEDGLQRALLQRKLQRRVLQRKEASGPISIKDDNNEGNVHTPDTDNVKHNAVGLDFTGMTDAGHRRNQPTTVRVVLERFEEIHSAFLTGGVTVLGKPEVTTLIPGDTLEVYCWGTNKSNEDGNKKGGKTAEIGFVSEPALASYLDENYTIAEAAGVNYGVSMLPGKGKSINNATFGMTVRPGVQGGFVLRGKVKEKLKGKSLQVALTQAIHPAGDKGKDSHGIDAEDDHTHGKLHEQGSFYGNLRGSQAMKPGQTQLIAAPGSTAYHQTLDRAGDYNDRAAAYWVPIEVAIHGEGGLKGLHFSAPKSVSSIGAGEGDIDVEVNLVDAHGKPAGTLMPRKNMMRTAKASTKKGKPTYEAFDLATPDIPAGCQARVHVYFRGSCATEIYMKGR